MLKVAFLAANQCDNLVVEISLVKANLIYKLRYSVSSVNFNAQILFTHATDQLLELFL
ncbi:MAG: hypothetical protein ACJA11_003396 [Glaciecola sp.]|jgi:hypothetical protein